ncbi:adhesion G-protein coupled receptor G6-like [Glandiceps talaboti]
MCKTSRFTLVALLVAIVVVTVNGGKGNRGGSGERGPRNKCRSEITYDDKGIIQWPSGTPEETSRRVCPFDRRQEDSRSREEEDSRSREEDEDENTNATMATRECLRGVSGPMWGPVNTSECTPEAQQSRGNRLRRLRGTFIPPGQAKKVADLLTNITDDAEDFEEEDVNSAVDVLDNILNSGANGTDRDTARSVLKSVSNMLKVGRGALKNSQKSNKGAAKLIKAVERLSQLIDLKDKPETIETDDVVMTVTAINATNFGGLSYSPDTAELSGDRVARREPGQGKSKIVLPDTLLDKLEEDQRPMVDRAQFLHYKSTTFFQAADENTPEDLNSVIAASVGELELKDLDDPVKITFDSRGKAGEHVCAFWDEGNEAWSREGCKLTQNEDDDTTVCECNHLTNFALLPAGAVGAANQMTTFGGSLIGLFMSVIVVFMY